MTFNEERAAYKGLTMDVDERRAMIIKQALKEAMDGKPLPPHYKDHDYSDWSAQGASSIDLMEIAKAIRESDEAAGMVTVPDNDWSFMAKVSAMPKEKKDAFYRCAEELMKQEPLK